MEGWYALQMGQDRTGTRYSTLNITVTTTTKTKLIWGWALTALCTKGKLGACSGRSHPSTGTQSVEVPVPGKLGNLGPVEVVACRLGRLSRGVVMS